MVNEELRDLLRAIVRNEFEETWGIACKVSNVVQAPVKGYVCDCEPINEGPTLTEVRIQPSVDGQVVILPAEGSVVYVIKEDESNAFISMFGRIDNIILFDGVNGGVPIAQSIANKLNVLEDRMTSHQHAYVSPSGPAITTTDPTSNQPITPTNSSDLENDKFLH